ncbi:lipid droplet-associated protein [Nakamurella sp. A5-74]|uniref:Lipid droplet-associated protein n=1 Tax=Nakamurella sp. A5-74 TaxID=3158264 RepID=A0AAU8DKT0_9ACTN
MSSLPFPLRLAAGVVATGIDTVRRLPEELPALGVRLAGTAAKLALQVRNEITELVIRGDELLEGTPAAQANPTWARFDDDTDPAEPPADSGADGRADHAPGRDPDAATVVAPPARRPKRIRVSTPPEAAAAELGDAAPGWSDPLTSTPAPAAGSADTIVAGYGSLTLGQLRSRLTELQLGDLRSLLAAEERDARRPAFLTLISNRIATLERTGS